MDYSPAAIGFGTSAYKLDFWLASGEKDGATTTAAVTTGMHVAFKGTRAQVNAFHEAALKGEFKRAL